MDDEDVTSRLRTLERNQAQLRTELADHTVTIKLVRSLMLGVVAYLALQFFDS